ncbi:MAG TPA: hypothetical protein VMU56_03715 [Beijerinckiaceae bacterium]|nr:hypothetical protein [Beijerinckiaceae bacterium]
MNALVRTVGSFTDRVSHLLEKVEYIRLKAPAEREEIFRLRYDAYLKEGAILANEKRKLADDFDNSENGYNFAIYIQGQLVSALRLHVLCPEHPASPAQQTFPDHLRPLVQAGKTLIDPNRFVADYSLARSHPQLPYVTLRLGIMLAVHVDADLITCTVRSEHHAFYKREYFAQSICEPRPYPTLIKPLGLMLIDFRRDRDAIIGRHGFYASTASERKALFGPPLSGAARPSSGRSFTSAAPCPP